MNDPRVTTSHPFSAEPPPSAISGRYFNLNHTEQPIGIQIEKAIPQLYSRYEGPLSLTGLAALQAFSGDLSSHRSAIQLLSKSTLSGGTTQFGPTYLPLLISKLNTTSL